MSDLGPPFRSRNLWAKREAKCLAILERALMLLRMEGDLPEAEVDLNRRLYFCLLSASRELFPNDNIAPTPECNNQPDPDDESRAVREQSHFNSRKLLPPTCQLLRDFLRSRCAGQVMFRHRLLHFFGCSRKATASLVIAGYLLRSALRRASNSLPRFNCAACRFSSALRLLRYFVMSWPCSVEMRCRTARISSMAWSVAFMFQCLPTIPAASPVPAFSIRAGC